MSTINTDDLYVSSSVKGSYFNKIIDCETKKHSRWVEVALKCLPKVIFSELKSNLAIIEVNNIAACRLAAAQRSCEVIILTGYIFPPEGRTLLDEEAVQKKGVRSFLMIVLHEIAHAYKMHKSCKYDGITKKENNHQEDEANRLAVDWLNEYLGSIGYEKYSFSIEEIQAYIDNIVEFNKRRRGSQFSHWSGRAE
ncbi:hypothetical protein ONV78_29090 [Hahella sp. CR1]|uniref:hypothetical protein n=1 Tax=Hahella sp. CR1 TaxID=2992807 RepID=UPI0024434878|nr:hypothetical protein [Hahella sp. CR1]MDG9671827.1 hypothetical protein [Hahella sp. CR1]